MRAARARAYTQETGGTSTRQTLDYYLTQSLYYAVPGTTNLLEYGQGFFLKRGDGAADIKPIAHLYKSQVYQMAESLGVPEDIRRQPTTDTYSLPQSQEEFYFSPPYIPSGESHMTCTSRRRWAKDPENV